MQIFSKFRWSVIVVLGIGSLQIIGFITQIDILRNVGRLLIASPLPFVFSDFRGLETFSLEFTIRGETNDGKTIKKVITPEVYGEFEGPYNRRNVYGAVLAYGPKLTEPTEKPMVDSVLNYGFCNKGPLTGLFGTTTPIKKVLISAKSKARGDGSTYSMEVLCL